MKHTRADRTADQVQPTPRGWWWSEALRHEHGTPAPPLVGDVAADVLIVGGGYTGMWSAYNLTEAHPDMSIALLEQEECGSGPSGRNGGFASGWWDELPALVDFFGKDRALAACRAVGQSVREIGGWCRRHGVDAWFQHHGYLQVATSAAQAGAWAEAVAVAERLGVGEEFVALSRDEVRGRCASPVMGSGALMRDGATVQPARLARGLRRVLMERGVRIYEHSPVRRLRQGPHVIAETARGRVRAERTILALNAWSTGWPGLRGLLVTWGSHIVLTAPAPGRLAELGWDGECISDGRTALHYFRTTPDGRIAFGGGGGRASWLGRPGPSVDLDAASIARAARGLRRIFPVFADVHLEAAWGGPIDVSPNHLPFFGTLHGNVHYGVGYTGNGVAPSHLGGKVLAGLALGREDEFTTLPMVGRRPRRFPPEPFRSIGGHIVRHAIIRRDAALDIGRPVGPVIEFVSRLPRKLGYNLGPE